MTTILGLAIALACALWVYSDARKRDWSDDGFANKPWKWAVGVMFLWIIAFPAYLVRRGRRPLVGLD